MAPSSPVPLTLPAKKPRSHLAFEGIDTLCRSDGGFSREELQGLLGESLVVMVFFQDLAINPEGFVRRPQWDHWLESVRERCGDEQVDAYLSCIEVAIGRAERQREGARVFSPKTPKKVTFHPVLPHTCSIEHTFKAVVYHAGWRAQYSSSGNRPGQAGYQLFTISCASGIPPAVDLSQPLRVCFTGKTAAVGAGPPPFECDAQRPAPEECRGGGEEAAFSYTGQADPSADGAFMLQSFEASQQRVTLRLEFALLAFAHSFIVYLGREPPFAAKARLRSCYYHPSKDLPPHPASMIFCSGMCSVM
ncbi:hypothetical protein DIPPA_01783 [Diplonema papillatum]|nr:hypothetical protein DIPPA_01783 [Diplonema papillatum]